MLTENNTPDSGNDSLPPSATGDEEGRDDNGKRRRMLGLSLIGLVVFCLGLGAWRHYARYLQVQEAAANIRDLTTKVRVAEVRASEGEYALSLPATTSAFEAANIYARASGYIEKRFVDIGSRVKAGDILAQISAPELDHQIALAQANLMQSEAAFTQAKANRDLAKVTYERNAKLVSKGYVSLQEGDVARLTNEARESDVQSAEANIQAQREQVNVLRQQKDYQKVVAPFDGVVTQRNVDNGSLIQADAASGTSLFTLSRSDIIRIQLHVPQDAAIGVGAGVSAQVRVPEIPGRIFTGKVTRVADTLETSTRTLLTEIDVPNADSALTPGIYSTVELRIPRKTPSLIVPGEAVIFNREGIQVAVVEDGVARLRKIAVVRDFGTEVEVSDGVKAGDKVVITPHIDLAEGAKVRVGQLDLK
jgi:RND family efflux transporter MFP subunit